METYIMDSNNESELALQFHSLVQESPTMMIVTFNLKDGENGPAAASLQMRVDTTGGTLEKCVDVAEGKLMKKFSRMVGEYNQAVPRNQHMPRSYRH